MNRLVRLAGAISILSLSIATGVAARRADAADLGNVVKTKSGKVSGTTVEDGGEKVHVFKGIPYAAPPVGELRWKAPMPVKPWSDMRDATRWSNQCAQRAGSRMGVAGEISEDCLYLVFFHGGGLPAGTGNSLTYNNTAIPRKGVVVAPSITTQVGERVAQVRRVAEHIGIAVESAREVRRTPIGSGCKKPPTANRY
jgi:hypothetical protein